MVLLAYFGCNSQAISRQGIALGPFDRNASFLDFPVGVEAGRGNDVEIRPVYYRSRRESDGFRRIAAKIAGSFVWDVLFFNERCWHSQTLVARPPEDAMASDSRRFEPVRFKNPQDATRTHTLHGNADRVNTQTFVIIFIHSSRYCTIFTNIGQYWAINDIYFERGDV